MSRLRVLFASVTLAIAFTSCTDDTPEASWARVDPPTVVDETDDVVVENGMLIDGRYWATASLVSGTSDIVFRVAKARFGEACMAWAAEYGTEGSCMNDYNVESSSDVTVALDALATVTVAQMDGPGTSYAINADALKMLMKGGSEGLPGDYQWSPFPFVVDVIDGKVVDAAQFWVP